MSKLLFIADLNIKDSPHVRAVTDDVLVEEYAEAMRAKDRFPPIVVFETVEGMLVADGLHRVGANKLLKRKVIESELRSGTRLDALKYALTANAKHGLRRSNADKRAAVGEALKAWPNESDNAIATLCLVSNHLVKEVREKLNAPANVPPPAATPAVAASAPATESPKPAKVEPLKDKTGWEIPEPLRKMWERNAEVDEVVSAINTIKSKLEKAQDEGDIMWAEVIFSTAIGDLMNAKTNITCAKSHAVCYVCQGRPEMQPNGQCPTCKGKGLLSKFRWDTVVPVEIKQIRQKTKK